MLNGKLVIDAVGHAYDLSDENRADVFPAEGYDGFRRYGWQSIHLAAESLRPGFQLDLDEWTTGWTAEKLASVFFEESDVDVVAYHGVALTGVTKRGISPFEIGLQLKALCPDRVLLYAPLDPLGGERELDNMQRLVEGHAVNGFKLYPTDGLFDSKTLTPRTFSLGDPEIAFPFFQKARELGITRLAVHKAVPVGPGVMDAIRVDDVGQAAAAFPDLTFEVVHSGWAFLEDCALQMAVQPNVWANLESTANLIVRRPRVFAHVIGTLLQYAGPDRIVFGTGAIASHPAPVLKAVAEFEMPQDLIEGYGFPEVTSEIKQKILGGNMATLHGLDTQDLEKRLAADQWGLHDTDTARLPENPWRARRDQPTLETV